jgi:ribosomal protein L16 Arg81 hydroxylase
MSLGNSNIASDLAQCRQMVEQLMRECEQFDMMFRQMQQQEAQNVQILEQEARTQSRLMEQMAQRERQAVQMAEMALSANQMSFQRLQQAAQICSQIEISMNNLVSNVSNPSMSAQTRTQQIQ